MKFLGSDILNPALIVLFISIILILLVSKRQKYDYVIARLQRKKGDKEKMLELSKNFIDKECIIYTLNSSLTGRIKEVSKNALLLETGNTTEAVNLDFVVRIREYPRKKNGKKKSVVLD